MLVYLMTSEPYEAFCLLAAVLGTTMFAIHKAWQWAWNRAMKGKNPARKSMWD